MLDCKPQANAVALNLDEEYDGYLIIIHYEMQINIELISELVAYYVYAMQLADESERFKFYPEMAKRLLHLINKKALFEEAVKVEQEGQKDLTWAGSIIASELFVAGMKFVIGHEIGHHFLKHTTSEGRDIVSKFIPKDKTFSVMHLDEFAADNFGFDLLVRGMKESRLIYILKN